MTIADSRGNRLVAMIQVAEKSVRQFAPLTHSLVVARFGGTYLFVFDKHRNRWELPGGIIETNETPRACAIRELYEETNQTISKPRFLKLMKFILKPDDRLEYGALYSGEMTRVKDFTANSEISSMKLWNLADDIGEVVAIDKWLAEYCRAADLSK